MYRQVGRYPHHWNSPIDSFLSPLNSIYQCTDTFSQLDVTTSKNIGGLFGTFTPIPINPSAHPARSHLTHHITSPRGLCTTILHNITKLGYYLRHITVIRNICHHIPDVFQFRIQYQVKSK